MVSIVLYIFFFIHDSLISLVFTGELDVFSEMEDIFFLAFLRRKKFHFKDTCLLMKKSVEFLETNRNYFNRIDTEILNRLIDSNAIGFLPYRDANGRALFLIKVGKYISIFLMAGTMKSVTLDKTFCYS